MGYTHYWKQTRSLTPTEMNMIVAAVSKIIKTASGRTTETAGGYYNAHAVEICGPSGRGKPVITSNEIAFNGKGPDLDHESFVIEPEGGGDFCKTARKPYDVVVVACLTMLATDYGFHVSSDGGHDELQAGVDLCSEALGREFPHPLTVELFTS